MLRKTLLMTLGSCLLAVLLSMTASCSDADYVKPDQVDARVDARWNELSKSLTEKVLANELAIAQLNSMLTALQQEHDDAYNKLQDMLQNFATKDYADYQAEQARLSAIDAAMALINDALANLTGTGEYQDLSGILDDIDMLKEADSLLSIRVMNVEAKITAVGISTEMPSVLAAANVITEIVMAAPSILMVAPNGMETEYMSSSRPSFSHNSILTGIFAAELLVKNAVIPLSLIQRKISGYGFLLSNIPTIIGETAKNIKSIEPTRTSRSFP